MTIPKNKNKKDDNGQTAITNHLPIYKSTTKHNQKGSKQKDKEKKKKQPKTPNIPDDGQTKLTGAAAFSPSSKDFPKLTNTPIREDERKPAATTPTKPIDQTTATAKTSSEKVSFAATVKKPKPPPIPEIHYHEVSIVIKFKFDNDRTDSQARTAELRFKLDRLLKTIRQYCHVKVKPIRDNNKQLQPIDSFSKNQYTRCTHTGQGIPTIALYTTTTGFSQSGSYDAPFPLNLMVSELWSTIRPKISFDISNDLTEVHVAPLQEKAELASVILPAVQNIDREAIKLDMWESEGLLIDILPLVFEKVKDRKGNDLGPGVFRRAQNMRDKKAMGYGIFVYNQDYSKAKNIFERKYPMEIRECLSSYPLDIAVSC